MKQNRRKVQWYHASPHRLSCGTVLHSFFSTGHSGAWVYLTSQPLPHYSIYQKALEEGYHIYEVDPLTPLREGIWDEACCSSARIIRYIGTARGLHANSRNSKLKRSIGHDLSEVSSDQIRKANKQWKNH